MPLLEVQHLRKIYTTRFGGSQVQALADVTFSVEPGEYVAIMGESGSGKTTLLNILAALDRPTEGEVLLNGQPLSQVRERDLAAFRRAHLGFVFQDFNLLDTFSLRDNIFLPLVLAGERYDKMVRRLTPTAARLGITELLDKYPYEVSGGQSAGAVRRGQPGRSDHSDGDPQCGGRQPCGPGAVPAGRPGLPPTAPGEREPGKPVPPDIPDADRAGPRRCGPCVKARFSPGWPW